MWLHFEPVRHSRSPSRRRCLSRRLFTCPRDNHNSATGRRFKIQIAAAVLIQIVAQQPGVFLLPPGLSHSGRKRRPEATQPGC